jgi:hypothetical protein
MTRTGKALSWFFIGFAPFSVGICLMGIHPGLAALMGALLAAMPAAIAVREG